MNKLELNKLEYISLRKRESFGKYGAFGIEILVAATKLPDLETEAIRHAIYEAFRLVSTEIQDAIIAEDPKTKKAYELEKEQLLSLFSEKIFYEQIPNGYCSDYCCRHIPWYIVTTRVGHIKIGWRKSVINIDWSRTVNTKTAKELFPKEEVTKGDKYIHAWSIKDAKRYIETILG